MKDQRIQDLIDAKDWEELFNIVNLPFNSYAQINDYTWDRDFLENFVYTERYAKKTPLPCITLSTFKFISEVRGNIHDAVLIAKLFTSISFDKKHSLASETDHIPSLGKTTIFEAVTWTMTKEGCGEEFFGIPPDIMMNAFKRVNAWESVKLKIKQDYLKKENYVKILNIIKASAPENHPKVYRIKMYADDMTGFQNLTDDPIELINSLISSVSMGDIFSNFSEEEYEKLVFSANPDELGKNYWGSFLGWFTTNRKNMSGAFADRVVSAARKNSIKLSMEAVRAMTESQLRGASDVLDIGPMVRDGFSVLILKDIFGRKLKPYLPKSGLWGYKAFTEEEILQNIGMFDPIYYYKAPSTYLTESTVKKLNTEHKRFVKFTPNFQDFEVILGNLCRTAKLTREDILYLAEKTGVSGTNIFTILKRVDPKTDWSKDRMLNVVRILSDYK